MGTPGDRTPCGPYAVVTLPAQLKRPSPAPGPAEWQDSYTVNISQYGILDGFTIAKAGLSLLINYASFCIELCLLSKLRTRRRPPRPSMALHFLSTAIKHP